MATATFTDQLGQLWRTRPIRLPSRGPGAGVAAGIAYRYGVDVVLIRVTFVVTTLFGGSGVVLYLAAWLLFTEPGDQASPIESLFGKGHSALSQKKTIVLGTVLVIAATAMGPLNIGFRGTGLIGLVALLGGWWLLHQRRPDPPPAPDGSAWGDGLSFDRPDLGSPATADTAAGPSVDDAVPPAWDPPGAARFTCRLPEPGPLTAPRARWTSMILGLAVLTAAGAGAAAALGVHWLTAPRIAGLALAVVGIGLVHGAFRRRGYGLLLVAIPLAGFVFLSSLLGSVRWDRDAAGTHTWIPATTNDLRPTYRVNFGASTLDLRSLRLTHSRTVTLIVTAGDLKVLTPPSLNVGVVCTALAGQCPPEGLSPDFDESKPVLNLNLTVRAGQVEVNRG
jgi:phage shock protein PspC (stress-responsive transcriptional regulator)